MNTTSENTIPERICTCIDYTRSLVETELSKDQPDLVPVSICLGVLEAHLTHKSQQTWPESLQADVEKNIKIFEDFVKRAAAKLSEQNIQDTRAKVKIVADLIWSHLTGSFSKDVQHVQHIQTFTQILENPRASNKRQLDCAGVVTCVLAACWHLAQRAEHADLAACALQVSEDHCWVNMDPEGGREGSVEVTTDTASKRGKAVSEASWLGWLYTGGHAVLCSPQMAVTALVASLNPSVIPRQNTGTDSEELQRLQHDLLLLIREKRPQAVYPAALCALADLVEVYSQDELQSTVSTGRAEDAAALLCRTGNDAQSLFEEAISASLGKNLGSGRCWYPYSYLIGFLIRRAQFILKDALPLLGEERAHALGHSPLHQALERCGTDQAASVLRHYRISAVDEQLYKDVEGVLEMTAAALKYLQQRKDPKHVLTAAELLVPFLELWDGVCCGWSGKPKPSAWTSILLRTAKLFSVDARTRAASVAQVSSPAMQQASALWGPLKLPQLKAIFEAADVDIGGRPAKRAKKETAL